MRPHHCDAFNIEHGMEQTSMTNAIKKRLDRKGFTLAEVLVTVAIILILAGVTFVSVVQYQKNLRRMEMDGTAKEIFIAAQNHLSVAQASGDLDRLAEKAKSATGTTDSTIGTKLSSAPSYAGNASGHYYYVIHNVNSGTEHCMPAGSDTILEMMLPFGALDETVSASGNYAIVYELDSASVVAVLYSGAGNASFGNAAVINFGDDDVSKIEDIYNDKSKRKSYEKNGVTAIVGCYTGTAGSAAIPTETLEAPKLEVKNENKLHVLVREAKNTDNITLVITGEQSGTTARRLLNRNAEDGYTITSGTFDVTLDDITGDGKYRFSQLINEGRFRPDVAGSDFIPGENIIISAIASSTSALATPKESAKYTVSSLFDDVNETTNSTGDTKIYIKNLRHLENLGANVSGFTAALGNGTTSGSSKVVNITAEQKNDITMFSMSTSGSAGGNHFENLRGSAIYGMGQEATFAAIDVNYPLVYHGNQHEIHDVSIGGQIDHTVAGIFGRVADPTSGAANASLSVSDLILRNNRVSGTNVKNAGMLVGETAKNLTVGGVLAYYHEDTYDETKDSSVEVTASENAGGLIGLVSGGKLDVKNSAAAVYVKGGSAAGGLIGSVSGAADGSTIVQSYAGGHTRDGAYSTTDATTDQLVLEGPGRYNVQASGYAGGFIGITTDKVSMNAVYSTASAYSTDVNKSGSFSGNMAANFGEANNYYAIGPHNGTDASADETAKAQLTAGQNRRQATAYDRTLMGATASAAHQAMDKTSYPLNTVRHLCGSSVEDKDLPWFIKEHVGDWVVSKITTGNLEIKNDVRLELDFTTSDTSTKTIFFAITGVTSQKTLKLMMDVTADNGKDVSFATHVVENGKFNTYWNSGSKKMGVRKTEDGVGYKFTLYLDDITTKQGHFADLAHSEGLIAGEDLKITVSECAIQDHVVTNIREIAEDTVNSLYDHVDWTTGTAYISSARHLENLDKNVAGLNFNELDAHGLHIEHAILLNNLVWTKTLKEHDAGANGFIDRIQTTAIDPEYTGKAIVCYAFGQNQEAEGCYKSIANERLLSLDGDGKSITNLDIYWNNADNAHNAGLMNTVSGNSFELKNLTLDYVQAKSANYSYAAALIGSVKSKTTIQNVHITGNCSVEGGFGAGGFIGMTEAAVNIENSDIDNATIWKGNNTSDKEGVGGAVGYTGDNVTVRNFQISNGNIQSCTGMAGGVIGYANNLTCFKNVRIIGTTVQGQAYSGGYVGYADNNVQITIPDTKKTEARSGNAHNLIQECTITSVNSSAGGLVGKAESKMDADSVVYEGNNTIKGSAATGGAVGKTGNGEPTFKNFEFAGVMNVSTNAAKEAVGGLIGYSGGITSVKNVKVTGKLFVSGTGSTTDNWGIQNAAGGVIGYVLAAATLDDFTLGENAEMMVTSTDFQAGGLIGIANATTKINQDVNDKAIISGKLTVSGAKECGGLVGTGSQITISNVEAATKAEMKVISTHGQAGGWIGKANALTIQNCYNRGKLTVYANQEAGGMVGGALRNTTIMNSSIEQAKISSDMADAGGVIGKGDTDKLEIKNVKVIGNTTEIIASKSTQGSGNAGGLAGSLQVNTSLEIDNTAVSSFIRSSSTNGSSTNGNAGGLIGQFVTDRNTTSTISKSYYGGRTTNAVATGPYSMITLTDENSTFSGGSNRTYTSNISAHNNVGGIIGYMQANGNVTIANCFSTGSVGNDSSKAIAGFIGKMYCFANVGIDYAYSMGTVAGNGGNNGGFIGEMIGAANFGSHVYYLDFLRSGKNAIGYPSTTSGDVQKLTSDYKILEVESEGTNTQQTVYYDTTLFGQYPYKNWMTDWEADGNPITYYGDWPQQLNGKFVYYRSLDNNYENGGMFAITGYGTSFSSNIVKQTTGVKLDEAGFGILCEAIDRGTAKTLYSWSSNQDGKYEDMNIDGSNNAPEYSAVKIGVKQYYFFRISKDEIENIANERSQNNTFYIKDSAGAKYEIVVQDQKATFIIIP